MADNQRRIQREEKRLAKDRRNKIIIYSILAVIVIVLVVMRACEININSVKAKLTGENGSISITDGMDDNFPYSIDASKNVILANVNNRLGILTPSSFTVINCNNGNTEYTFNHRYSNPILAHSGIYTLLVDQGTKNYRLDTTSGPVFEETADSSIFCADVTKGGNIALATASKEKHYDLLVYNESLKCLFNQSVSDGYPIAVALSDNSRRLAVAAIDSVNASLVTTVNIYNVKNGKIENSVKLPDASLADMKFSGGSILVVGDNYAGVIKGDKYNDVYKQGDISTLCYDYTPSGELVLVYNEFNNSATSIATVIRSSGKIRTSISISGNVKDVSASSSLITVLTNNRIYSYATGSGKEKSVATCDDSVKSICRLGSDVFCHKQTVIEKSEVETN